MFVWHCRCILLASTAQFPKPNALSNCITCGSTLFKRRIVKLGRTKKLHMFRTHSRCVSVRAFSSMCTLFSWCTVRKLCQIRASNNSQTRTHSVLCEPNGSSAWPLFAVYRPGVFLSGHSSMCADQAARLPGHSFLQGWQVERRWSKDHSPTTSIQNKNGNTQRRFRVLRDACVCAG